MCCISLTSLFSDRVSGVSVSSASSSERVEHGPEVVTDAGEHRRALLDVRLDAVAHLQERLCGLAHLARAARAEILRHRATLAESVGGFAQPQDGPDLVAEEQDGDGEQDHRGADHPEQEDVRVEA